MVEGLCLTIFGWPGCAPCKAPKARRSQLNLSLDYLNINQQERRRRSLKSEQGLEDDFGDV